MVKLFNDTDAAQSVVLGNTELTPGQTATGFGTSSRTDSPSEMPVTIPAHDVTVMHIKQKETPQESAALKPASCPHR
jgi:hypothetical protein